MVFTVIKRYFAICKVVSIHKIDTQVVMFITSIAMRKRKTRNLRVES